MNNIVFIDSEVNPQTKEVLDLGAIQSDGNRIHTKSMHAFADFLEGIAYICGHNIMDHDMKYIAHHLANKNALILIDTLYLSPLLFPNKPYHALLKDDKLQSDILSNPLNDAVKAMELFYDEVNAFEALPEEYKQIYFALLHQERYFSGFFKHLAYQCSGNIQQTIQHVFAGKICEHAPLVDYIEDSPVELAYSLSLISVNDRHSITPPWVLKRYPRVRSIMHGLRGKPCNNGCAYCENTLHVRHRLKELFGYESFRTYDGEPLQERAADAAAHNRSLLAIFPTGGGKSITFQLPALIAGEAVKGLTIVISPLQSLMKDQVDNLEKLGIVDAVTINGLLSPIERAEAIERVENGLASLLYISPESLRSKTIEKLMLSRHVARFVIDEAHCFSAWGQDFRVDYLYIGAFIRTLQEKKQLEDPIPVSCFTATAKPKVVSDIKDYFKRQLNIELALYATGATRTNLRYEVLYQETDAEKYTALRNLIAKKNCPTIVYVSRTRRTHEIAKQLNQDGFCAKPYNGKMESSEKIANQEAFLQDRVQIMVATSAFGMGVDKKDVGLVVHYEISDSLENYVQEAGRAGRDQEIQADCYVLFNDSDLDKHFTLLNQTKLSISEIQQVWKAVKDLSKNHPVICSSALEIARQAGWVEDVPDIETRVKTAISALETAGYLKRGYNVPKIYATSICVHNMEEAVGVINRSTKMNEQQRQNATRIIKSLISSRSIATAGNDEAESRVDYLSDRLGISKADVISSIQIMREDGLLADAKDLSAYIQKSETQNKSAIALRRHLRLEAFLLNEIDEEIADYSLKKLNEQAIAAGIKTSTLRDIRTILYYWMIQSYIRKAFVNLEKHVGIELLASKEQLRAAFQNRKVLAEFVVGYLFSKNEMQQQEENEVSIVHFSVLELQTEFLKQVKPDDTVQQVSFRDVEEALLYLSKIDALHLEGGFLVLYSGMQLKRLVLDNKIRYKNEDYKDLNQFYKQKMQQIHIVGEYANMMVRNYQKALQFVNDYFQMEYQRFLATYFEGKRAEEIERNITPQKYQQLIESLSEKQSEIIHDDGSQYIVVIAGPGSGKTRVLVHKLASLFMLEDVKHEQLLMLTFSRAATTEFKTRLKDLIGNAANFVEIKTFHSYCFDLLGKIGNLEKSENIVKEAAEMILQGQVEAGRITKSVVVIDEAQDMDENEYRLIQALMQRNEEMRVIAVGDDDQNIYEFRGSSSRYLEKFLTEMQATKYEMLENYRSCRNIVALSNDFVSTMSGRLKSVSIQSMKTENGIVQLIHHTGQHLVIPLVEDFKATYQGGNACILTETNDEAMQVMGLLEKDGVHCKLIQSNDGMRIYNLAEIRYFLKNIKKYTASPMISDAVWQEAKQKLSERYPHSACMETVLRLLDTFERVHPTKYHTDLMLFIDESKYEDFELNGAETVVISTIHKSKGREFDCVYMALHQASNAHANERKRAVYVGMTRAKKELHVHYTGNDFQAASLPYVEYMQNTQQYGEPEEIGQRLSYTDVFLDFSKDKANLIFQLCSGEELFAEDCFLCANTPQGKKRVLRFSKKYREHMNQLKSTGYELQCAKIRFIVAWKGKEDEREVPVILPDLYYKRVIQSLP